MKKIATLMVLFSIVVFAQQNGSFTDSRDGKRYQTVKIGKQTWMAENLNFNNQCYDNNSTYCQIFGGLYNWWTAKAICPVGWHLPSNSEWNVLITSVGGEKTAGKYLKSAIGWSNNGNGEDKYGFTALPGGIGGGNGYFIGVGGGSHWWTASEYGPDNAYYRFMFNYRDDVGLDYGSGKSALFSVRCLRD